MSIENGVSRRDTLRAGVSAAFMLARVQPAPASSQKDRSIPVGMATTEFRGYTNAQLAKELSDAGIRTIQFFLTQTDSSFWRYNERADVSSLTPERCAGILDAYRSAGISIHSIGVYANLIHPDESERRANLAYFDAMMKVGGHMGVRVFASESGHYRPKPPQPPVEDFNWREDVWRQMVATCKDLARVAEAHDAKVLLESHFTSFLATAKRTRVFLEEVGSPRLGAVLDPANLLEANDLEEMFNQLQPWIGCFHAKDRKLHVIRGVGAGEGDLDYTKFVTLAARHNPGVPLFLEYVGAETYKQALSHLRKAIREAGLVEA